MNFFRDSSDIENQYVFRPSGNERKKERKKEKEKKERKKERKEKKRRNQALWFLPFLCIELMTEPQPAHHCLANSIWSNSGNRQKNFGGREFTIDCVRRSGVRF